MNTYKKLEKMETQIIKLQDDLRKYGTSISTFKILSRLTDILEGVEN